MEMLDGLWQALEPHIGALATFLLLTNLVFVAWLAKKIDKIDRRLPLQDGELKSMAKDVLLISQRLDHMDAKMEDVAKLRERIAVLEDRSSSRRK